MPQGIIREQPNNGSEHSEKFIGQQGREFSDGNVENAENQEIGENGRLARPEKHEDTATSIKSGEGDVISKELQEVRQAVNKAAEKSDTVVHQQLIADILNEKVDVINLENQGSAFNVRQSMIENAKKNAENSKN